MKAWPTFPGHTYINRFRLHRKQQVPTPHAAVQEVKWNMEIVLRCMINEGFVACMHQVSQVHNARALLSSVWSSSFVNLMMCGPGPRTWWCAAQARSSEKYIAIHIFTNYTQHIKFHIFRIIPCWCASLFQSINALWPAFLAKIWQTIGAPAINAGASHSRWIPAPQICFFGGC